MLILNKNNMDVFKNFINNLEEDIKNKDSKFKVQPPSSLDFFENWIDRPLFPKQQEIPEATFTNNYQDLSTTNEFVEAIGKRGGKDYTIANLSALLVAWLLHLRNPHNYLGIKSGEPIDIVNISFDEDQAKTVFFEKFQRLIRNTTNPKTGKNFFEEQGMNLDKDIQKNCILFPKNIRAWSLNSIRFKAEGKNIVFAIFDEIASFRFDKAESIRRHIKSTAKATCPEYYKLFYISFLTSSQDYMAYLIDQAEKGEMKNTHFMRAATWEIRSAKNCPKKLLNYVVKKETFQDDFDTDPENAMLMFECKIPKVRKDSFIKRPEKILQSIDIIGNTDEEKHYRPDPRIEQDNLWVYSSDLLGLELESWFRPNYTYKMEWLQKQYEKSPSSQLEEALKALKIKHQGVKYYCHLDLSRGVVDTASIVIGHPYYILDRLKVHIDLMLQIRAKKDDDSNQEIDLSQMLYFIIYRLHKKGINNLKGKALSGLGFNISKITADGWNSALFLNLCEQEKMKAKYISLERTTEPYDTAKDFMYRGDLEVYYSDVYVREWTELIIDNKGKIDHPRTSKWRQKSEKLSRGSKDLSDGISGIASSVMEKGMRKKLSWGAK